MLNFNDIFVDDTKYGMKIPKEKYLSVGLYPVIDQSKEQIAGYTDESEGIYCDVPAIIFGDHTRIIKYIDVPFFLGADGTKLLKIKDNTAFNCKYLYYALSNAKIPNTGYNRHFKWLKELSFNIPSIEKQREIADLMDIIVNLENLRKKQLEKLELFVKSRFIEMFGDPITNSKKKNETEFINVCKLQRGFDLPVKERDMKGNIEVFGSNGVLGFHNESKVKNGGVITGRSGSIGNVYYTLNDYWPLNTTLFSIDTHGNNIIYLAHLLKFFDLNRFAEGTGVPTLNRNIVHRQKIIDVALVLQNQFADFVAQVDKSKLAIQQSLDALETLKKSLMQQYFG